MGTLETRTDALLSCALEVWLSATQAEATVCSTSAETTMELRDRDTLIQKDNNSGVSTDGPAMDCTPVVPELSAEQPQHQSRDVLCPASEVDEKVLQALMSQMHVLA